MIKHPVYKAINRPLTIFGIDRRLLMLAVIVSVATFQATESMILSLLFLFTMTGFARWATTHDPEMVRIFMMARRLRPRYDTGKHQPFHLKVR